MSYPLVLCLLCGRLLYFSWLSRYPRCLRFCWYSFFLAQLKSVSVHNLRFSSFSYYLVNVCARIRDRLDDVRLFLPHSVKLTGTVIILKPDFISDLKSLSFGILVIVQLLLLASFLHSCFNNVIGISQASLVVTYPVSLRSSIRQQESLPEDRSSCLGS